MTENHVQSKYFSLFRHRIAPRTPNALILASVVSGFAWYFTSQQAKHFNEHQQELIARVEKGEVAENCKSIFMQLKQILIASRPVIGTARKSTSMVSSKEADFSSRGTEENRKDTLFWLPLSSRLRITKLLLDPPRPTKQLIKTESLSSTWDGSREAESISSTQQFQKMF
jgi:hypothetical protein